LSRVHRVTVTVHESKVTHVQSASSGEVTSPMRRSDVHEEAPVKTGARRWRDFPDIHSASSARAERPERVCGRSPSIPRRRDAPRRTSGCDLGPAFDLDLDDLRRRRAWAPRTGVPLAFYENIVIISYYNVKMSVGGDRERLAWGAGGGHEHPCSPARGRRHLGRTSLRRLPNPVRHQGINSSLGTRGQVET
jgi:hypothetical protein